MMGKKLLLGCVYCEQANAELDFCCRFHSRLVCAGCTETPAFLADHTPASKAS